MHRHCPEWMFYKLHVVSLSLLLQMHKRRPRRVKQVPQSLAGSTGRAKTQIQVCLALVFAFLTTQLPLEEGE